MLVAILVVIMAKTSEPTGVVNALLLANLISLVLFGLRVIAAQNIRYWFLVWNLALAWLPVLFVWLLIKQLKTKRWQEPLPMLLTLLWLGFLPNSFYLISDLIHLQSTGDIGVLFDTVMFMSFILNGLVAGYLSLYHVHKQLIKRKGREKAHILIGVILLLVSFAIYLGRTLRWNSWDVLLNPAGVLFDVSERVISPLEHPQAIVTTTTFFLLLGSVYIVIWQLAHHHVDNKDQD